jgi:hypothetical protein
MSIKLYPEPLGSIFLTGPDGIVYEFPEAMAKEYRVSAERVKELGHLPIAPYTKLVHENPDDGDEVSARHYVLGDDGQYGPHAGLLFGTAFSEKEGCYCTGFHYHPDGGFAATFLASEPAHLHLT